MGDTLQVSRSGYYSWIKGEESARSRENRRLTELVFLLKTLVNVRKSAHQPLHVG